MQQLIEAGRYLLRFTIELMIGAALLILVDVRYFLFYALVLLLYATYSQTAHLRRMIHVNHFFIEMRLMALCEKNGLTGQEMADYLDRLKERMPPDELKALDDSFHGLGIK